MEKEGKKNLFAGILQELIEELLGDEHLETALAGTLEILMRTLKCEAGTIWLLDSEGNSLVPMFHAGPLDLSNFSVETGSSPESFVIRTGEPLLVNEPAPDARFTVSLLTENGLDVRNMICVPLNNLHQVVGCLQLVNKSEGMPFTNDEFRLCSRTAALAAMTIDEKGLTVNAGRKKEVLISMRGIIKDFPSGDGVLRDPDGDLVGSGELGNLASMGNVQQTLYEQGGVCARGLGLLVVSNRSSVRDKAVGRDAIFAEIVYALVKYLEIASCCLR